jgi:hypothetical protein
MKRRDFLKSMSLLPVGLVVPHTPVEAEAVDDDPVFTLRRDAFGRLRVPPLPAGMFWGVVKTDRYPCSKCGDAVPYVIERQEVEHNPGTHHRPLVIDFADGTTVFDSMEVVPLERAGLEGTAVTFL